MTATERLPGDYAERERATDPTRSIIAQAPAGAGKTTLLTARYLKLLTIVERPEEILAITFTRKAAAEMRSRILRALADRDDPIAKAVRARSAALGWGLPEHSGRLCVQTIDSFAATIVRCLPVATGFGPNSRLEERPISAYRRAVQITLARIAVDDDPLADDVADLLGDFDNRFEYTTRLLTEMLARRDQWFDPLLAGFRGPRPLDALFEAGLEDLFAQVVDDVLAQLTDAERSELTELACGAATNLGYHWPEHRLPEHVAGWRQLAAMFCTADGRLRRRLTRAQGFPAGPGARPLKERAMTLLDELGKRGLDTLLSAAVRLPDPTTDDAVLRRMATVLSLAAVELGRVFDAGGLMDFTELTLAARRALGSEDAPTDLALALDYRIRHLLIDEFQDTSVAQFRLFRLLVAGWQPGDGRTFFAVGDPMQSVYRFRDAEVALFTEVARHGIGALRPERVRLTSNFRACAELVHWTNRCFSAAFGSEDDPVLGRIGYAPAEAARPASGECAIRFEASPNRTDEAWRLAERIGAMQRHLQTHDSDATMALLVRSRTQLPELLTALEAQEVDWQGTDIHLLANDSVVMDLLSLLHALHDPTDRIHWLALARCPLIGLTLADLEVLADDATSVGRAMLSFDPEAPCELSADAVGRLQRVQPILAAARARRGRSSTRRWLENTWMRLGGASGYPNPSGLHAAERFLKLLDAEFTRSVDFDALHAATAELYADDDRAGTPGPTLHVMTIHKAKGLEFDHVFLPGLERPTPSADPSLMLWRATEHGLLMGTPGTDLYRWLRFEDAERDRNEQLRLLYVACTRARQTLHLSMAGAMADGTVPAPARPSLLHRIWAALDAPEVRPPWSPPPGDAGSAAAMLSRLPSSYEWRAPVVWPDIRYRDPLALPHGTADAGPGRRFEIALGIVLHDALRELSDGLPDALGPYVRRSRSQWAERLAELGLGPDGVDTALTELARQLQVTLAEPDGRWLLGPRDGAESEASFTGLLDGSLVNIVVDRTFLDEEGTRWIVDFKSSRPAHDQSLETFVSGQLANHASQLRRYRRVLAALDGQRIRAALYFTAIGRLEELPPSPEITAPRLDFRARPGKNPSP